MKLSVIKKRTIKEQVLFAMTAVALLAIVTLGAAIFSLSKQTIERNFQSAHTHNLGVSSNIIEIQLKAIVELSRTLLVDADFMDAVAYAGEEEAPYFNSLDSLNIEHAFRNISSQNTYIQNMIVISKNGNIRFYTKLSNQSGKMSHYYDDGEILEGDWVQIARQAKGREIFLERNVLFDDKNMTFSMVKEIISPSTGDFLGYLIVNVKKEILDEAFGEMDEDYTTNRYLIVRRTDQISQENIEDRIVYFNGKEDDKQVIVNDYLMFGNDTKYLFSSVQNDISGWEIVNVIEKDELSRDSSYIGWIALLIGILMLSVCVLLSTLISRAISKPLVMLESTIKDVGNGNYRVEAEFDESEIGRIGSQFKHMVNNNLELHERLLNSEIKEKEAELLLLQSQINPHFLYNTLDALYFMAVIDQADDVAEMVLALSDTFKLSLNKGDKLIFVRDEIAKIKAYMKVQNMRHHNRFQFQVELDDEMLSEKMLTFILQPLVENAVYHGLEPRIGSGYIRLEGYMEKEEMIFHIRDNGVGIDDLSKLEDGYGVKNIRERIKLFYGEEYDVIFDSRPGEGTTVTIILPVIKEESYVSDGCRR